MSFSISGGGGGGCGRGVVVGRGGIESHFDLLNGHSHSCPPVSDTRLKKKKKKETRRQTPGQTHMPGQIKKGRKVHLSCLRGHQGEGLGLGGPSDRVLLRLINGSGVWSTCLPGLYMTG